MLRSAWVVLAMMTMSGCARPAVLGPSSLEAETLARTVGLFFVVAAAVLAAVTAVVIAAVLRRRVALGPFGDAPVVDRDDHGPRRAVAAAVAATVVVLAGLVWVSMGQSLHREHPAGPVIEVVGHMWWWELRYLEGARGEPVVSANELHLPLQRTTTIRLQSADVIHSFWVPSLGGKSDLLPARSNELRITPQQPGIYAGVCAEFCGLEHARMQLRVYVDPPEVFEAWAAGQAEPAADPVSDASRAGQAAFLASACVGCHAIRGTPANGRGGPDLTHVASRATLVAGALPNTPEHLARWLASPRDLKPGTMMPPAELPPPALGELVAYLASLR
jgi:cytochrome c oxidase subunit II